MAPLQRTEQIASPVPDAVDAPPHAACQRLCICLSYAEEDADFLAKLRAFFGERGYAYWEYESSDRDYQKRVDLERGGYLKRGSNSQRLIGSVEGIYLVFA